MFFGGPAAGLSAAICLGVLRMKKSHLVLVIVLVSISFVGLFSLAIAFSLVPSVEAQEGGAVAEREIPPAAHLYVLSPTDGKVIFYKAFARENDFSLGEVNGRAMKWYIPIENSAWKAEWLMSSGGIILIVKEPLELDAENRVVAHPPQKKK